jgi:hypothetical protein
MVYEEGTCKITMGPKDFGGSVVRVFEESRVLGEKCFEPSKILRSGSTGNVE